MSWKEMLSEIKAWVKKTNEEEPSGYSLEEAQEGVLLEETYADQMRVCVIQQVGGRWKIVATGDWGKAIRFALDNSEHTKVCRLAYGLDGVEVGSLIWDNRR